MERVSMGHCVDPPPPRTPETCFVYGTCRDSQACSYLQEQALSQHRVNSDPSHQKPAT